MFLFSRSADNSILKDIEVGKINWLQLHLVTTASNSNILDPELLKAKNINVITLNSYSIKSFLNQYDKFINKGSYELGPLLTNSLIEENVKFFDTFVLTIRTGKISKKALCGNIAPLKILFNKYKLVHMSPVYKHFDSDWSFYVFEPFNKDDLLIK